MDPAEPDNVSDTKRRAIEQRVARISEALDASPLLLEAVEAISAHFGRLQAVREKKEEQEQAVEVVAYGLGSFSASSNAVYQLALLVALERALTPWRTENSRCPEVFDPVMNEVRAVHQLGVGRRIGWWQLLTACFASSSTRQSDVLIAERFGLRVLRENECGRRQAAARTVFFMPHCGKSLYENVVASNWGRRLGDVVIVGNR